MELKRVHCFDSELRTATLSTLVRGVSHTRICSHRKTFNVKMCIIMIVEDLALFS